MLAGSGETTGGIVIQQMDQEATQFCRVLSDALIWFNSKGFLMAPWGHELLGDPKRLLNISLESGPRSFYVSPHFDSSNKPLLPGVGFSFTHHKCISGKHRSKEFWAEIESTSGGFYEDVYSESPTWFARFQPEKVSKLFQTSERQQRKYLYKVERDHCVVIGVDVLPKTVIGTTNTFLQPWIINTDEASPEEAIRLVDSYLEPGMWREADVGLWYDIRITWEGELDD
ncbi:HET domain-containing protein [Fusarium sp. LHS14.1]|nr:HET domain-containing protein [Fusarium sp. LHS14.1]